MKRTPSRLLLLGIILAAGACSSGESAGAPDGSTELDRAAATKAAAPATFALAGGTQIEASLNAVISSKNGAAGDVFTATVSRDVLASGGRVAIPSGSTVSGTIAEVKAAPNDGSVGTLTLVVSSVTVRGHDYPISASLDSLMTVQEGRGLERADVIRVAGGGAAGSIIGHAIGKDTKGTIIGGIIGAAAGAAMSVLVKDQDIVLPSGAQLMLTLRESLKVLAQ
jgi:hypothetical protein